MYLGTPHSLFPKLTALNRRSISSHCELPESNGVPASTAGIPSFRTMSLNSIALCLSERDLYASLPRYGSNSLSSAYAMNKNPEQQSQRHLVGFRESFRTRISNSTRGHHALRERRDYLGVNSITKSLAEIGRITSRVAK